MNRFKERTTRVLSKVWSWALACYRYLEQPRSRTIIYALQWLGLFVTCIWVVVHISYYMSYVGDEFVTTYIFKNFHLHYIHAAATHTNILKFPVAWLVANTHFTYPVYVLLNFLFVFGSFAFWIYLAGRLFNRKIQGLLAVLFMTFSFCSPILMLNLTEVMIRNIEYPLALWFIVLCVRFIHGSFSRKRLVLPAILLALLVVHDYFFLYTLAPAMLITTLIYARQTHRFTGAMRQVIGATLLGVFAGILLGKFIAVSGFMTLIHGYAEPSHVINLEALPAALLLTLKQILQLFGASIFGLNVRLGFAGVFALFGVFCYLLYTVRKIHISADKKLETGLYLIHLNLLLFATFIILSYTLSGLASIDNIRYLTGLVYIGITYLGWGIYMLGKDFRGIDLLVSGLFVCIMVLSIPQVRNIYIANANYTSLMQSKIQQIVSAASKEHVDILMAPNGYAPVRFYSNGSIHYIVEIISCNAASTSTNNTAWLKDGHAKRVGIIVDYHNPPNTIPPCSPQDMVKTYGKPDSSIAIPSLFRDKGQATMYVYDSDIRGKLAPI